MKGKLIKMVEGYTLLVKDEIPDKGISLTGDIDDLYAISSRSV